MGAYRNTPYCVCDSDEISSVDPIIFNRYQELMLAEQESEEKTLLDLLNEVEEELYENHLSEGIVVYNANKLEISSTKPQRENNKQQEEMKENDSLL